MDIFILRKKTSHVQDASKSGEGRGWPGIGFSSFTDRPGQTEGLDRSDVQFTS